MNPRGSCILGRSFHEDGPTVKADESAHVHKTQTSHACLDQLNGDNCSVFEGSIALPIYQNKIKSTILQQRIFLYLLGQHVVHRYAV